MQQAYAVPRTPYAGFWLRFVAYLIDNLILGFTLFAAFFVAGVVIGASGGSTTDANSLGGLIAVIYAAWFVAVWLYFAIFESSGLQATPGKLALGLKVTTLDGARIGFGRATGRFFAKLLSGLILLIGFILAAFTERKQALHDLIAMTLVVRKGQQPGLPVMDGGYHAMVGAAPPPPPPSVPPPPPPPPSSIPPPPPPGT